MIMSDREVTMSDDIKNKFTPQYAEYQKYLEDVLGDEPINKESANEVQAVLQRESKPQE